MRRAFIVDSLRAVAGLFITGSFATVGLRVLSADTTKTCLLTIAGMTCAGCEAAVRIAARRVAGVHDVTVSYAKGSATVTYEPGRTSPEAIARAISEGTGFRATVKP
jgi:copper chaperone CopZ